MSDPDDGIDLLGMFWRHHKMLTIVLATTLGLGALYYLTASPTYESTAEILIETRRSPAFNDQAADERQTYEKNIETHAKLINSEMMIRRAIDTHQLAELRSFDDDSEEPTETILENLLVEIHDDSTPVLMLYYRSAYEKECEQILTALVNTYHSYLDESSESIGEETTGLIVRAKDELLEQLREKEQEYNKFRSQAPLLWKDGEGTNLHHERQMELEKARSELVIERTQLRATLERVEKAMAEGGESRDAVYFEALKALRPSSDNVEHLVEREAARGYSVELSREYVELVTQEKRLSEDFGEGHPDLLSIRNRVAAMKTMLNRALSNDDKYYDPNEDSLSPLDRDIDYVTVYRKSLHERLDAIERQLGGLTAAFEQEQADANVMQHFMVQDETLRSDIRRTEKLFDIVVARLEEINIVQDYGGDTMRILARPKLGEHVAPSLLLVLIGSMLSGGLLGGTAALVADRFDATYRSPEEIRNSLQTPVIGRIPFVPRNQQTKILRLEHVAPIVCTAHRHDSTDAEAYRAIRTALYFGRSEQDKTVLQITSPMPSDGKSTLVANLAVTIAKSGKRVVVVDADFRRPTIHRLFGLKQAPGLAAVVQGTAQPSDTTQSPAIDNLSILTAGKTPENPSELLSSPGFSALIGSLREQYDFVLIDTPPLLAVSDPAIVAAQVDGVIMAFRLSKGVQVTTKQAKEILDRMGTKLLGVVVNAIQKQSRFGAGGRYGYSGYGYGYGYGQGGESTRGRKTHRKETQQVNSRQDSTNSNGHGSGRHATRNRQQSSSAS
jgi:capsular exopolysaccharide synthesis family protein